MDEQELQNEYIGVNCYTIRNELQVKNEVSDDVHLPTLKWEDVETNCPHTNMKRSVDTVKSSLTSLTLFR